MFFEFAKKFAKKLIPTHTLWLLGSMKTKEAVLPRLTEDMKEPPFINIKVLCAISLLSKCQDHLSHF